MIDEDEQAHGEAHETAHAVPGAEGVRVSTFDEDVAAVVASDALATTGNASRNEMVNLLNKIRVLSIITILVGVGLILLGGGMFTYQQNSRADVRDSNILAERVLAEHAETQSILCSLARDLEVPIPEECPTP